MTKAMPESTQQLVLVKQWVVLVSWLDQFT